jgi:hypothetical protein
MNDQEALRAALLHIEEAKEADADGFPHAAAAQALIALAYATLYPYLPVEERVDASDE